MMNKIRPLANQCYNSAKKKTKSSGVGSSMLNLTCYMNNPNSPIKNPHIIKIYSKEGYYRLPEWGMASKNFKYNSKSYSGWYERGGVQVYWIIDRSTGGIIYKLSMSGAQTKYHEGVCKKTSGGQKF